MTSSKEHLLLLVSTTGYTGNAFREAASRLGVAMIVGSDRCHVLADQWPEDGMLTLDFRDPARAVEQIVAAATSRTIRAILPSSELTATLAARASARLGLPHNAPEGAAAAGNKAQMRERLAAAGVRSPVAQTFAIADDPRAIAERVGFPCVLKPLLLSASRGVIRADDATTFVAAWRRIAMILALPELLARDPIEGAKILVEPFVPGFEVAVEGLLSGGALRVLAIFDKPDPLDGPYFEETIYVTPSRLDEATQQAIAATTADAARALGLCEGPLHAELRINAEGPWVIEVAARSIGGLCGRALRFGVAMTLEELLVGHAMGIEAIADERESQASGVMMIPTPRAGILEQIEGVEAAKAVSGIDDVSMRSLGSHVAPPPDGDAYLGFIFARGPSPELVESALREAHGRLVLKIAPLLPTP
ncbi:MAG: ATP-grasp domain-containing protein [Byssovorax sp.]